MVGSEIVDIVKEIHFASFSWLLLLPASMMAIDIITGLMYAWSKKTFQSAKMRSGLVKKAGEMLVILIGVLFTYGMGIPIYILNFVSLYIIIMELMSVVENLDKLGVPLPKALKDVINNVGESLRNDDMAELMKKLKEAEKTIEAQKAALVAMEVEEETRIKMKEGEHGGSNGNF